MSKVLDTVNKHIVPIIETKGYEVVEVTYAKEYDEMHLCFFIHKKGGVTLDDCEYVSGIVDIALEECDPTGGLPYVLDISSPGLDRPIKTDRDFLRSIGERVEVSLYAAIDKKKNFNGILKEKNDKEIILKIDKNIKAFPLSLVAKVKPYISFNIIEGEENNEL